MNDRNHWPKARAGSRRGVLKAMGLAGLAPFGLTGKMLRSSLAPVPVPPNGQPVFEIIPNSRSGTSFVRVNGRSPERYLPETLGDGGGFIHYDNDGWMDIYLMNSGKCDFYSPDPPLRNALYHHNRDGTFTDVTEKAGMVGGGYGVGVAVGDYDGDGWPDLFLTQYERCILYHNNGDGTFTDVTEKAGVSAPGFDSSALWFDYDNDGRLDRFVCRSVKFSKSLNKFCGIPQTGQRFYSIPNAYEPMPSSLFHNNGDGTFTEVSKESGIAGYNGIAWSVVATDINNDGLVDPFVANDMMPNFLLINRGNGKFKDIALYAGVGYSVDGTARSGMGCDSADYDQDGWMDLFLTDIGEQLFSLYHNNHDETFNDASISNGIGMTVRTMSGWGVRFLDYDNDGNMDIFIVNGHPDFVVAQRYSMVHYRKQPLLWRNTASGNYRQTYQNVSDQSGPVFQERLIGRGLAIGDFNNDGGVDVLIIPNWGGPCSCAPM